MKKTCIGIFFMILILALVACSEDSTDKEKKGGSSASDELTFGNIAYDMKDVWNMYSVKAFEFAGEKAGVKTIVLDAENNLEKSVTLMEDLINKGVDGISIYPISPDQAATLSKMANDAGIPVTFENLKPSDNAGEYISTVAAQYDIIGEEAIKFIAETWPGSKVLFVAGAKGGGVYEEYQVGIDRALEKFGDNIEIVETVHGDWETEKSMNVTQNFIQTGKKFDVVFANNELQAKGVHNALEEAGIRDQVKIVSTGGGPDGLAMINSGELNATMSAPVSIQGLTTFKNLYQTIKYNNPPEKYSPLPIVPVTADGMDKAIKWEVDDTALEFINGLD